MMAPLIQLSPSFNLWYCGIENHGPVGPALSSPPQLNGRSVEVSRGRRVGQVHGLRVRVDQVVAEDDVGAAMGASDAGQRSLWSGLSRISGIQVSLVVNGI
jgi:hypothetical protein